MRAQFVEFSRPNEVRLGEEAIQPPRSGEVRCRGIRSLISPGTELACLRGEFDPGTNWAEWVQYPFRPGYSMVATVTDVGDGVHDLEPGAKVVAFAPHQSVFTIERSDVIAVPAGVADEVAAWTPLAITAGVGVERSMLRLGDKVAVIGLGPVGQLVVQYASARGCSRVVAIDSDPGRLELARTNGATDAIAGSAESAPAAVADITAGALLDVVFDVTGNPTVLASAVQCARELGIVVLLGDTPNPSRQALGPGVVSKSLTIIGAHANLAATSSEVATREAFAETFYRRTQQGSFNARGFEEVTIQPREAPDCYARLLRDGSARGGVVYIDWSSGGARSHLREWLRPAPFPTVPWHG